MHKLFSSIMNNKNKFVEKKLGKANTMLVVNNISNVTLLEI